jgi:RpiR family carbohydrate utilization transcriptional regulator
MDRVHNLLEQIQRRIEDLNKAERKVAEVILRNPQQATRFSIATLAQTAQVSEPTVNRFCRSFGVSGYPELKMQLALSLASGAAYVSQAVEPDDGPAEYTPKIFGSAIASLDSACQSLDPQLVSRAVDLMIQARQIHFFGLGASATMRHVNSAFTRRRPARPSASRSSGSPHTAASFSASACGG